MGLRVVNRLLGADTQPRNAASRCRLHTGQRQRWASALADRLLPLWVESCQPATV